MGESNVAASEAGASGAALDPCHQQSLVTGEWKLTLPAVPPLRSQHQIQSAAMFELLVKVSRACGQGVGISGQPRRDERVVGDDQGGFNSGVNGHPLGFGP